MVYPDNVQIFSHTVNNNNCIKLNVNILNNISI